MKLITIHNGKYASDYTFIGVFRIPKTIDKEQAYVLLARLLEEKNKEYHAWLDDPEADYDTKPRQYELADIIPNTWEKVEVEQLCLDL